MEAETSGILSPQRKLMRFPVSIRLRGICYVLCYLAPVIACSHVLSLAQIIFSIPLRL